MINGSTLDDAKKVDHKDEKSDVIQWVMMNDNIIRSPTEITLSRVSLREDGLTLIPSSMDLFRTVELFGSHKIDTRNSSEVI